MTGKVCNRRLVDAAACVDVHGVDDFVGRLRVFVILVLRLILSRRRQQ